MFPANTWCFDLEIVKAILSKGEQAQPGIQYCGGWTDFAGMGVSVLVAARPDDSEIRVFTNGRDDAGDVLKERVTYHHLSSFPQLVAAADLIIGHNSRSFDAKVLGANGIYIPEGKHLDFYHEVKGALRNNFPRGYKLDDICGRCAGPRKTESGALAPHMWQRGEKQRVIDYCINDIKMTTHVARFYHDNNNSLPTPDGKLLSIRHYSTLAA